MSQSSFKNVLKNKSFLALWLSQILSQLADKVFFLLMVVLVTEQAFSNSSISFLTLVMTIPAVFFGAIAGVFVDRFSKRKIMFISNIFRALIILALPLSSKIIFIYLITFLVSSLTQFFAPAETAIIPNIVKKENLLPANSLFMGTMLISVVLGFGLGEPIISKLTVQFTHFIIALMYISSALILFFVKINKDLSEKKVKQKFVKEFISGLNYVKTQPTIFSALIKLTVIFSAFAALSVLVIGFVNDVLFLKPAYFGYLLSISGLGMAFSAILVGKFGNNIGKGKVIKIGFIFTGIFLILLANTHLIAKLFDLDNISKQEKIISYIKNLKNDNKTNKLLSKDQKIALDNFYNNQNIFQALEKIDFITQKELSFIYENIKKEKIVIRNLAEISKKVNLDDLRIFLKIQSDQYSVKILDEKLSSMSKKRKLILENILERKINFSSGEKLISQLKFNKSDYAKSLYFLIATDNNILKSLLKKSSSKFEFSLTIIFCFLVGFFAALCVIPLQTLLQEIVEENMRGRVFGVQNMAVNIAMTLPMVVVGFLADFFDKFDFILKGSSIVIMLTGFIVLITAIIFGKVETKVSI